MNVQSLDHADHGVITPLIMSLVTLHGTPCPGHVSRPPAGILGRVASTTTTTGVTRCDTVRAGRGEPPARCVAASDHAVSPVHVRCARSAVACVRVHMRARVRVHAVGATTNSHTDSQIVSSARTFEILHRQTRHLTRRLTNPRNLEASVRAARVVLAVEGVVRLRQAGEDRRKAAVA